MSVSVSKILFATDFSSESQRAAQYARLFAHHFNSLVEIAHVFDPDQFISFEEEARLPPMEVRRLTRQDTLDQTTRTFLDAGITATPIFREGQPVWQQMLAIARQDQVDLIIAGTHSKGRADRLLIGSVAEQLIRNAEWPVLTVEPRAHTPEGVSFSSRECGVRDRFFLMRRLLPANMRFPLPSKWGLMSMYATFTIRRKAEEAAPRYPTRTFGQRTCKSFRM